MTTTRTIVATLTICLVAASLRATETHPPPNQKAMEALGTQPNRSVAARLNLGAPTAISTGEKASATQTRQYPAPAKPLPTNPYAGNRGLTLAELADRPGPFVRNLPLPGSVPPPVFLPDFISLPDRPPFVSPAFQRRIGPALGTIPAKPPLPYRTPAAIRSATSPIDKAVPSTPVSATDN